MKGIFSRTAPSLALFLVFIGFILLWFFAPRAYFELLVHAGFLPTRLPMDDMRSVLQAVACRHDGINVYAPSPCMGGGVYNYSPFLLHFPFRPQLPKDGYVLGVGLDMLFIASLSWLPPAQTRAELILRIACACSGNVLFVLERGNIDEAMFCLAVFGIIFIRSRNMAGLAGYFLFLLGGACKFYPASLLLLALREGPRRLLLLALLIFLGLAFYIIKFGAGTLVALSILPKGLPFQEQFGAVNLPLGIWVYGKTHMIFPGHALFEAALGATGLALGIQVFIAVAVLAMLLLVLRMTPHWEAGVEALTEEHRLFLVGGGTVIALCFFMAQNIPYRAVFLLLTLPGLCRMAAAGVPWMRASCIAILCLLWQDSIQMAVLDLTAGWPADLAMPAYFVVWLLGQLAWWSCVCLFVGIIICFLRQQEKLWREQYRLVRI